MKISKASWMNGLGLALALTSATAHAYPVNPSKVAVSDVALGALDSQYTLAYDSSDKRVIYYAPKTGRVALFNGMPLLGFAKMGDGRGVFNAQFEFLVSENDRKRLFQSITDAGYTPVPMPFYQTTVKPMIGGWDPETGKRLCAKVIDPTSGQEKEECDASTYDALSFIKNGPTLGENIAVSAILNPFGAAVMGNLLRGGNAIQVALEAKYYTAGDAFTAVVEVNYEKLYESFSAFVGVKGFLTSAQAEAFWDKQALCPNKDASQCSVRVTYFDGRGRQIDNVTLDPENPDMKLILQVVDRLRDRLQDELMQPVSPLLSKVDSSNSGIGYKYNANFQHRVIEKHARFEFKSPRGVNSASTVIVANAACIQVNDFGQVTKDVAGDCGGYWNGTVSFEQVAAGRGSR